MEQTPVKHGGRYQVKYRGNECLNCGHPLELSDRYCPNCSQANSTKHLTIRDYFEEYFSDLVNLDTRLMRTLRVMLWQPGKITLDFIAGKRLSYANPFRLLLSLAIVYFLMLNFTKDFDRLDRYGSSPSERINLIPDLNLDPDDPQQQEAIAQLDSLPKGVLDSLGVKLPDSLGLKGQEGLGFKETIKETKRQKDSTILSNPLAYLENIKETGRLNRMLKKADFFLTLIDKDSVYTYEDAVEKHGLPYRQEDRFSFGFADSIDHLNRQPGSFVSQLISTIPFAIFLFLPLFTIFLRLVYIRKTYTYTDNLIFSFHSQSLFFILLIISFLVDAAFGVTSIGWFLLVFLVYLYLSMRRFYGQGWLKTTIKYLFLNTIFVILASVAAAIFLIGNALTY
ncbi:DUF3667 domain-containing protein [Robiginitalea marina]|uniref:DUF3667 domain-containing protein n=1 Tax=Robiginitalea marina TaxID=2954105 RepID=A0ABT1AXS6_9FLAO|nr:DUF3667 domain-containing protein [Robiginitalea marina]MCO5724806.1 DUF3667 domain-containing protein [Robiginitalea marina]